MLLEVGDEWDVQLAHPSCVLLRVARANNKAFIWMQEHQLFQGLNSTWEESWRHRQLWKQCRCWCIWDGGSVVIHFGISWVDFFQQHCLRQDWWCHQQNVVHPGISHRAVLEIQKCRTVCSSTDHSMPRRGLFLAENDERWATNLQNLRYGKREESLKIRLCIQCCIGFIIGSANTS